MKKITQLMLFGTLVLFIASVSAQSICTIQTSKTADHYGELGIDSSKLIFGFPNLLSSLSDEANGDPTPYYMYDSNSGPNYKYFYLVQNDTLYQYYPAVKKKSKHIMYLKGNEVYLGSYYNQNNGIKDYVFDNTQVGILSSNGKGGLTLEATVGLSEDTIIAITTEDCKYGIIAAYSFIFTASELMEDY